jgi:hypothetical protein
MSRLAAFLFAMLMMAAPAFAQTVSDGFTVRGIDVDVTAASANAAKEEAVAEAQRKAFRELLDRLITSAGDRDRLPKTDALAYVRDYTVEQERTSAVRYIASLTVRFNPGAVKKLLRDAGIAYAEARTRPVVVVPLYRNAAGVALWDDPNPWRTAWAGVGGGGLVPLVVPPGDLSDVQTLTPDQALANDAARLTTLGARWRTSDVLVALAAPAGDGKRLDVTLTGLPGTPLPFDSVAYDAKAGETADQLLARAARDVARAVDAAYKQANAAGGGAAEALSAIVPLSGFEDWLAVRDRLSHVPLVRSWELVSLSKAEAAVVLHAAADQEKVKAALANAGLRLEWGGSFWTMRTAGR